MTYFNFRFKKEENFGQGNFGPIGRRYFYAGSIHGHKSFN